MSENIKIERIGSILHIALARIEKKNALTSAMYQAMIAAMQTAQTDGTRAIVISGGAGVFCAGNDIADFLNAAGAVNGEGLSALNFIKMLAINQIPLIAAVDGFAIGIGTTLILHCDLVYASPRALFSMPFVDLALVPEAASSMLLPQRIGMAKASEFLMMGEPFDAAEALRLGLVNAIVAPSDLLAHAVSKAQKLAQKPVQALAATRLLLRGDSAAVLARIEAEMQMFAVQMKSAEARQIFGAFLAKAKG